MNPRDDPLRGRPFPPNRLHPKLYAAELLGTALLVLVGLSIVIALFGDTDTWMAQVSLSFRRALGGGLFGLAGTLITISAVGRTSGAHINPAVTLAFWLGGKIAGRDALGYVGAQFAGGFLGALPLLAWGAVGASANYGATKVGEGIPVWEALMGEIIATGCLVLTIFITLAHPCTRRWTPWTLPPLFAWLVYWEAPLSGTSTNPARSLGPAAISGQWHAFWIYIVGPVVGAALAVGFLRLEVLGRHRIAVASLFHFD